MPTFEDALRLAREYTAAARLRTGKPWRGLVQEFEHGWAIWMAEPQDEISPPPIGSGNKTVLDRETGRISHWPAWPVETLAHQYAAQRVQLPALSQNLPRMNIRLPEPPDGLSALHRTAHLEAPDGRRWFQANALTDDIPQHHPLVAQWLADQSRDHPGSLARGADRHAVLWTLSDALQDLDPAELATCQVHSLRRCATCVAAAVHFGVTNPGVMVAFAPRAGELRLGSGTLPGGSPFEPAAWAEIAFRMLEDPERTIPHLIEAIPRVEAARPIIERYPLAISDRTGPGRAVFVHPFRLAITEQMRNHGRALADFGAMLGAAVFPLGEVEPDGIIAVDEHGRLFVLDEGGAWYCGRDIDNALRMLLEGEDMPRVRADGSLSI